MFSKLLALIDKYWTVDFHVAGVNPGTTVAVVCPETRKSYVKGHANQKGEFRSKIPRRLVGKQVFAPVRQAGLRYDHDFYMIVQPWGLFRAIKQTIDFSDESQAPVKQKTLNDLYQRGDADIQFAVRQVVTKTIFTWVLLIISLMGFLIKFVGLSDLYAVLITLVLVGIKTFFTLHALGLKRKALYKEEI